MTPAQKLLKEIQKDTDKLNALRESIRKKQSELRDICTHEDTTETQDYVPGGYLDRCQYVTRKRCNICGFQFEDKIVYGGYC